MSVNAWMPMYWGDYTRDTAHLSAAEHGAYLLLIGHYWTTASPLPDSDEKLRRIARMDKSEWKNSRDTIAAFFVVSGGVWTHKRIDSELKVWSDRKDKFEKRAKRASSTRWASKKDATSITEAPQIPSKKDATSISEANFMVCPSPSPSPSPEEKKGGAIAPLVLSADPPRSASRRQIAERMVAIWDEICADSSHPGRRARITKLTEDRVAAASARFTDTLGKDFEAWAQVCRKVMASPLLTGFGPPRADGSIWKGADLDWCLSPKHLIRIMEGSYDKNMRVVGKSSTERRRSPFEIACEMEKQLNGMQDTHENYDGITIDGELR